MKNYLTTLITEKGKSTNDVIVLEGHHGLTYDMTIGELKALQALLTPNKKEENFLSKYIGKYVICRTRQEGINAGVVSQIDETGVVLNDARRLWFFKPKEKEVCWYEGVAKYGVSEDSKLSPPVEKVIVEDFSLTICTKEAENSIRHIKSHEQN